MHTKVQDELARSHAGGEMSVTLQTFENYSSKTFIPESKFSMSL